MKLRSSALAASFLKSQILFNSIQRSFCGSQYFGISASGILSSTLFTNNIDHPKHNPLQTHLNLSKTMSTSEMRRGLGGRIEETFASAKERGEAAFVSFVTAGYPTPEGK
jgi:hypothetical protein